MQKVLLLFSVLLIIFALPRGFDFSDEGLYLLLTNPNQQNLGGIFNYDLFFKALNRLTGIEFGIIGLRILRLLSYVLGAFGLAIFWKNLWNRNHLSFSIFLLGLAGLFGGYAFLPPSLSYNSISVVVACLWLATLSGISLKWRQWVLLGLLLMTLFYTKISVCLLLGTVTIIYGIFQKQLNLSALLLLLLPTLFFELFFYGFFRESAISRLLDENGFLQQRSDYSLGYLVKYTAVGGFWILLASFSFGLASWSKDSLTKGYWFFLILAILLLGIVFYWTRITSEWSHFFLLLTFASITYRLGNFEWKLVSGKKRFFFVTLLALPFMLHFGSNVYWMRLGIHYWVFWVFTLAMLLEFNSAKIQSLFYQLTGLSSLILVVFGIWFTPFEGSYLWHANEKWEYRPGKEILLSPTQVDFLDQLKPAFESVESGKVASLYMNPGLLYLLGGVSPAIPGYWKPSQATTFLSDGSELDLIFFNQLDSFPFPKANWEVKSQIKQPNGEPLQVLWRK